MRMGLLRAGTVILAAGLPAAMSGGAWAQADQPATPETTDQPAATPTAPSITSTLPALDPGGVRAALTRRGVTVSATYIGEVLGNVSGGARRGSIYQGRLDMQLEIDAAKATGLDALSGVVVHANGYQIHGHGLTGCCVGSLATASGIEAVDSTRLFEAWVEKTMFGGTVALRAGQLAADTEFLISQYSGLFVNATFGWPTVTAADLPSGGPAYPLATPGIRLKLTPTENLAALLGVFNGDPAGPGLANPQLRDASGGAFRTGDSALVIGEVAYSYNTAKGAAGLPGTVKLGGIHHFGRLDELRTGSDGLSLADPNGTGTPRRRRGGSIVYAVVDQLLYRVPGTEDQGLGGFVRLAGSPTGRTSFVDLYVDGGLTFKGLLPGRGDDTAGLGLSYARVSGPARGLDRDAAAFGDPDRPIRSSEVLIEASYQAQVIPGFTLQPDLQYIIRPGAHAPNPFDANGRAIRNATIVGMRATVRY